MIFDVFFSVCQVEVDGHLPDERTMISNFFEQAVLADKLGFDTAWLAESHLSTAMQKCHPVPVVPGFKGEIGLNTDVLQWACRVFSKTKNINCGSAIRNILCNGGPLAHAENIRTFLSLHDLEEYRDRKLRLGFASGRFPYSNEPYGIVPRDKIESCAWPVVRGLIFKEATEIFLRALRGDAFASSDVGRSFLEKKQFRTADSWQKTLEIAESLGKVDPDGRIPIASRWDFLKTRIIPKESNLSPLQLVVGSHDPEIHKFCNLIFPTWLFNLSITPTDTIEKSHEYMAECYHKSGGPWERSYMPRTSLVFVNNDSGLSSTQQREKARKSGKKALEVYWRAMEGTVDSAKIESAVNNTLCGNPAEVADQIRNRFASNDRIMLWFDFSNHNHKEVLKNMELFHDQVLPLVKI